MSVKFTILGSGSAGNCAYIETPEARILVDAGFSPMPNPHTPRHASASTPENLTAIFITHEHSDHIAGLLGIADISSKSPFIATATRRTPLSGL